MGSEKSALAAQERDLITKGTCGSEEPKAPYFCPKKDCSSPRMKSRVQHFGLNFEVLVELLP